MNWKLLLTIILIITVSSGVAISGYIGKSNGQTIQNTSTLTQKYDDDRFMKIVKEAYSIVENDKLQLMTAIERGDFENIEKYGKSLESDSTKYISMIEDLTVSPKLMDMYFKYHNFLENMNKTGRYFQESAERHKSLNISVGSCNNPYINDKQMEPL